MSSSDLVGCYAVIFISNRTEIELGYNEAAEHMLTLAAQQPGYLGVHSVRDVSGLGITVSYWQSEQHIKAWREHAEHSAIREQGRASWYQNYALQVCKIERAYQFEKAPPLT